MSDITTPADRFAQELEAIGIVAVIEGVPTEQFWAVLARFVGYSFGNDPAMKPPAIVESVQHFAKMVQDEALEQHLKLRKEKSNG